MTHARRPRRNVPAPRRAAVSGYRVDIPRSLAALITGDPALGESATRLLAYSVIYILRSGSGHAKWAHLLTDDPDEFVVGLRELHDKGWMSIWDGRAYLSEPVRGPLGNVVDRVRMTSTDRRAFAQFFGDTILDEMGEAAG
jgi:hypothetical protein